MVAIRVKDTLTILVPSRICCICISCIIQRILVCQLAGGGGLYYPSGGAGVGFGCSSHASNGCGSLLCLGCGCSRLGSQGPGGQIWGCRGMNGWRLYYRRSRHALCSTGDV